MTVDSTPKLRGRPPSSERKAQIPNQRCTPSQRLRYDALRAKIDRIGIDGMLDAIEAAPEPEGAPD